MQGSYYDLLNWIKSNPEALSQRQKVTILITTLGEYPDTLDLYVDRFISQEQRQILQRQGLNGWEITQNILANCEIRTSNSLELTYKYYGYVKTITPSFLDQLIDDVATRIQLENEYSRLAGIESPQLEQEDELTLGELGQSI